MWEVVSDPRTHPDWWPEVVRIDAADRVAEGDEYVHTAKMMRFVDAVDSVWVVERLAELKEAQFRCTMTGTWARFTLTPAQDETFVEMEAGIDPDLVEVEARRALPRAAVQALAHRRARRASRSNSFAPRCRVI